MSPSTIPTQHIHEGDGEDMAKDLLQSVETILVDSDFFFLTFVLRERRNRKRSFGGVDQALGPGF